MGACIINRTAGVVKIDQTYNSTSANAQSGVAVAQAINALNGTISGTAGAAKTLTAFSQTNGKVSATFGNISITKSQVSDFPTSMTPTSHTHGNITNDGKISSDVAKGSGDKLVLIDSNDNKIIRSNISLGTGTTTYLRNDGAWGTPAGALRGANMAAQLSSGRLHNSSYTATQDCIVFCNYSDANTQIFYLDNVQFASIADGGGKTCYTFCMPMKSGQVLKQTDTGQYAGCDYKSFALK